MSISFKQVCCLLTLALLMFSIQPAVAGSPHGQAGTAGGQFLKIGVGARPIGMGGAYTALSDDAGSVYWNPAGLTRFDGVRLSLMHNKWIQGVNYEFLGLAYADSGASAFAFGLSFLWMGEIPVTTFSDPLGASGATFTANDLSFVFSYAYQPAEYLSLGGTLKRIRSEIADITASTTALDLGAILFTPIEGATLGATLQNMGGRLKFVTDGDKLPFIYKVGAAYTYRRMLTLSADVGKPIDNRAYVNAGGEFVLLNTLALRGGYNSSNELDHGFTGGAGVRIRYISVDYAYVPYGILGNTHRISASFAF